MNRRKFILLSGLAAIASILPIRSVAPALNRKIQYTEKRLAVAERLKRMSTSHSSTPIHPEVRFRFEIVIVHGYRYNKPTEVVLCEADTKIIKKDPMGVEMVVPCRQTEIITDYMDEKILDRGLSRFIRTSYARFSAAEKGVIPYPDVIDPMMGKEIYPIHK